MTRPVAQLDLELLWSPIPTPDSFATAVPSVVAVHDLQHRIHPEFPEVSSWARLRYREFLYGNIARSCHTIVVDSQVGAEDLMAYYGDFGLSDERIEVLPFCPSPLLPDVTEIPEGVLDSLALPEDFVLYPAQFWPHKNHARLIEAVARCSAASDMHLVLVGGASGRLRARTRQQAMTLAGELGIVDRVHELGYVSDVVLAALYTRARGLVFPTFFGPTNLPILEAWRYACPVITSDIRGIREQCGDGAVLVDPLDVESIAHGLASLWESEDLRREVAEVGRHRLASFTFDDFRHRLSEILERSLARLP